MAKHKVIAWLVAIAILWWLLGDAGAASSTVKGSVTLGDGSVVASDPSAQGVNDYLTNQSRMKPDQVTGHDQVEALIRQSDQAIAAFDADQEEVIPQ